MGKRKVDECGEIVPYEHMEIGEYTKELLGDNESKIYDDEDGCLLLACLDLNTESIRDCFYHFGEESVLFRILYYFADQCQNNDLRQDLSGGEDLPIPEKEEYAKYTIFIIKRLIKGWLDDYKKTGTVEIGSNKFANAIFSQAFDFATIINMPDLLEELVKLSLPLGIEKDFIGAPVIDIKLALRQALVRACTLGYSKSARILFGNSIITDCNFSTKLLKLAISSNNHFTVSAVIDRNNHINFDIDLSDILCYIVDNSGLKSVYSTFFNRFIGIPNIHENMTPEELAVLEKNKTICYKSFIKSIEKLCQSIYQLLMVHVYFDIKFKTNEPFDKALEVGNYTIASELINYESIYDYKYEDGVSARERFKAKFGSLPLDIASEN